MDKAATDSILAQIRAWAAAEHLVVGFAPLTAELRAEYFKNWLGEGKQAGMAWMDNPRRTKPEEILPGAKTVIVVGMNYYQPQTSKTFDVATWQPLSSGSLVEDPEQAGFSPASKGWEKSKEHSSLVEDPEPANRQAAGPELVERARSRRTSINTESPGRYATYALGGDYHKILFKKLKRLCTLLQTFGGDQKPSVDTAPILEKRFAAATALGWQGKNTLLISPEFGPWLSLGTIFTTLELPVDSPFAEEKAGTDGKPKNIRGCGSCTRCMTACPTGAITAPYQLDARRCLAYWTIEHKGEIPEFLTLPLPPPGGRGEITRAAPYDPSSVQETTLNLHKAIGDRLFGCDECLSACPWNKFAKTTRELKLAARAYPSAEEILQMDEAAFAEKFAGTPIKRLGLERLKRNARIVVKNAKATG